MRSVLFPFLISAGLVLLVFALFSNLEAFFTKALDSLVQDKPLYALVSFALLAADVILPVPSSIILYSNGYVLGLLAGFGISLAALLTSSVVGYGLGRFTVSGAKSGKEEYAMQLLQKHGAAALLLTRGIPVLSESLTFVCGYNRLGFSRFFFLNAAGYIPVCLLYSFCGSMGYTQDIFLYSFGLSVLAAVLFWAGGKRITRNFDLAPGK